MSGSTAEQDNSIEEILASIRQIISEDEPKAETPPEVVSPAPAPEPEPVTADDVFELVDRVVAQEELPPPAPEPVFSPEPVPEPAPITVELRDHIDDPVPPMPVSMPDASVFTDGAAAATLGAFAKLSETIVLERQRAAAGAVTLEDIVKELLSPLLRGWIDQHVPVIVERLVREELEKLARQAREG